MRSGLQTLDYVTAKGRQRERERERVTVVLSAVTKRQPRRENLTQALYIS